MLSILTILTASTSAIIAAPAERGLESPSMIERRPAVASTAMRPILDAAAEELPAGIRRALAGKPAPWLLNAHDVGEPTDFHKDIPWQLLDKERDRRFDVPHRGKIGVFNTSSDVNFFIGMGVDGAPVNFSPNRRYTDHLINLAVVEVDLGKILASILFLPATSDTLLTVVEVENRDSSPRQVLMESVCTRPTADKQPFDRYGYGVTATTGKLQWVGWNEPNGALVSSYEEWIRRDLRPGGSLLCTMVGSLSPSAHQASAESGDTATGTAQGSVLVHQLTVPAGEKRTLCVGLNLHRYGPEQYESPMEMILYPKQTEEQALQYTVSAAVRALETDWPRLIAESYKWYRRCPMISVPSASWTADFLCALELPRANTWSPQEKSSVPWYTLCRPHVNEPYGWWSYGMHGHEHLSTFVVNLTEPGLSQHFLSAHLRHQQPDGRFPYGVNHRGVSAHCKDLATAPLLAWEAWTAYLWSGDRAFLSDAYEACSRAIRWWRSPARTRPGTTLQHWKDFIETVRDDGDLATWTATGKAQNQEALDLNCYLLNEEQIAAEMARELGRKEESARWQADAEARVAAMRRDLWHAEDGVYYGRDIPGNRWAQVMDISTFLPLWCDLAVPEQVPLMTRLLRDPDTFGTEYPVATLAVKHMPDKLKGQWHWRGANWVEMTWLAILGLKRAGEYDEAARLAEINTRMVFRTLEVDGHFREYYNSLTGEPADLTDYIWTSMPAIMLVDVILGVRPTAEGVEIMPALPAGWPEARIADLQMRDHRLSVRVRRDSLASETTASVDGAARPVIAERGILLRWDEMPRRCTVEIVQGESR